MEENLNTQDQGFSPFDAPKKEVHGPTTDNSGMKTDRITDSELDGGGIKVGGQNPPPNNNPSGSNYFTANQPPPHKPEPAPTDVPEFTIPKFDEIPGSSIPPLTDQPPGFGSGGAGKGGGGNNGGPSTKVDGEFAKEFGAFAAKWIVDLYFRFLLMGIKSYAKIDRSEILGAIRAGNIDQRFLKHVDQANRDVEDKIYVTDEEKKLVTEPLKYLIEVKKINIKPEYMSIGGLVMVSAIVAMRSVDIKKSNKELLDKIMEESAKIREGQAAEDYRRKNQYGPEVTEQFTNPNPETFSVDNPPPPENAGGEILEFKPENTEVVDHEN